MCLHFPLDSTNLWLLGCSCCFGCANNKRTRRYFHPAGCQDVMGLQRVHETAYGAVYTTVQHCSVQCTIVHYSLQCTLQHILLCTVQCTVQRVMLLPAVPSPWDDGGRSAGNNLFQYSTLHIALYVSVHCTLHCILDLVQCGGEF